MARVAQLSTLLRPPNSVADSVDMVDDMADPSTGAYKGGDILDGYYTLV